MTLPLDRLEKTKDRAIFFGCGPSIKKLSGADFTHLGKRFDTWANNNFLVHDYVPDFYHMEIKAHRNLSLVKSLLESKGENYLSTKWILDATRPYLFDVIDPNKFNVYEYLKVYRDSCNGKYTPEDNKVSVSCAASLSCILDMMARLGYKEIWFAGVDMYNSEYFWTDNSEYVDAPIPPIMRTCKPDERDPSMPHPTVKMARFIKDFGEHNGIRMVNISVDSVLSEMIETVRCW